MPAGYTTIALTQVGLLQPNDVVRFPDEEKLGWVQIDSITPKNPPIIEVKYNNGDGKLHNIDKKGWAVVEVVKK